MNVPSKPQQPSTLKAVVIVIVAIALLSTALWYWRINKQSEEGSWSGASAIDVVAVTVTPQAAPVNLETLGEIRAVQQVNLSAEVAGRVVAMQLEPGSQVKAGHLLVQLDDSTEQADLAAAEASARFAHYQLQQATELAAIDAISNETLQQRRANYDIANAQIKQLQARIQQKRILAPFDGELGLRHIDLGQYLNPGDTAASLTDFSQLYVNFNVPQQELSRIRTGQTVQLFSDLPGSEPVQATISAVEPQISRSTRNASIQAKFTNSNRSLQPGMYVTVKVHLPEQPNALILPASAVMTSSAGDTVVVVRDLTANNSGTGDIVPVKLSRRIGDQVIIAQGIQAGDTVLTEGQLRVRPGTPVRVLQTLTQPATGRGE